MLITAKNGSQKLLLIFQRRGLFEDLLILMYESNPFKHLIKESLLVSRDKPLLIKLVKSIPPPIILIPLYYDLSFLR